MKRTKTNGSSRQRPASTRIPLTIRLPEDVVKQIDQELDHRDVPLSRNNWLLEAAIEKLRRYATGGPHGAK